MLTPGCSLVKAEGWDLKVMRVSTHSTEEQNQKMARAEKYIACGNDKADGSATPGQRNTCGDDLDRRLPRETDCVRYAADNYTTYFPKKITKNKDFTNIIKDRCQLVGKEVQPKDIIT